MKKQDKVNFLGKLGQIIDKTDIRVLWYLPPIVGILGFFGWYYLVEEAIKNGSVGGFYYYFALGTAMLILCIPGIAGIRKKEMPISFGRIIKGKIAVVIAILFIVFFGFGSLLSFGLAILELFRR